MNRMDDLRSAWNKVTRSDLRDAKFGFPPFASTGWQFSWLRLSQVAALWRPEEGSGTRLPFERLIEDIVVGLHSQHLRWAFVIQAEQKSLAIHFGVESGADLKMLESVLRGALPEVRLGRAAASLDKDLSFFPHAMRVVGCPSWKTSGERGTSSDQIERLCRGLLGERWAYVVVATPWRGDIAESTDQVAQEIRRASDTFLLTGRGVDEHHRLARQYIELLEAKFKRLEYARTAGLWSVGAYLLAENDAVCTRGSALLAAAFAGEQSRPDPLSVRPCHRDVDSTKPPEPLTSRELAVLTALPREDYPGYEVIEPVRFGVATDTPAAVHTTKIGRVLDRGRPTNNDFVVDRDNLTKHGLIVGVTGSGKTNTCFSLLEQIWDQGKGVPFLVVESAKSEYRALLQQPQFSGLRVFTVGDETVSPFRLNPFEVPSGVLVQRHIDYLKTLFAAAFVLYPPMPYVLEQSLHEVYEERGWDLAQNENQRGARTARAFPTLSDLYHKVGVVIDRMGYDTKLTMDIRAGLQARIHQLRIGGKGSMLDTRTSIPMTDLFHSPCILELKQLVSDDEKAFLMGLILIRLYEYYESGSLPPRPGLRHVTLIEEAHRLLRNVSTEQGSEVTANPKGHAIEVFANLLSEIRAYGEGMLIAEQVPTKLAPDALKNTNLKIVHRLLAEDDRRAVGATIGLSETQSRLLPSLPVGEAIGFAEGMRKPVLLSMPLAEGKRATDTLPDATVRKAMQPYWQQRTDLRCQFVGCTACIVEPTGSGCGRAERIVYDANVTETLRTLMTAMLYLPWHVEEAYRELLLILRRFTGVGSSPYCVVTRFFEEEIERCGAFSDWNYSEVEKGIELSGIVAQALRDLGDAEDAELDESAREHVLAFSRYLRSLNERENGPLPGCVACPAPCQYRFAVQPLTHDTRPYSTDFRTMWNDNTLMTEERVTQLSDVCWQASTACVNPRVVEGNEVRRGLAFCFATHALAGMGRGLSVHGQQDYAETLRELIEQKGEDSNG